MTDLSFPRKDTTDDGILDSFVHIERRFRLLTGKLEC